MLDYHDQETPEYLTPFFISVTPCGKRNKDGKITTSPLPSEIL